MTPGFTRYTPADGATHWLFVAGKRFVAAFESTVSDAIIDAVWWLAESDLATIESVVGAFPLTGPDAVRSFAVAELGDPNGAKDVVVTAVVRGSAVVDVFSVGGSRRFAAGGVQPWVLAEFRSVTGLVLGGDELPTGPVARTSVGSLPLAGGIVDGELLVWSAERLAPEARNAPRTRTVGGDSVSAGRDGSDAVGDETIIRPKGSSSIFAHAVDEAHAADEIHAVHTVDEMGPVEDAIPVAHELPGAVDIEPPLDPPLDPAVETPLETPVPATEPVSIQQQRPRFAVRLGSGQRFELDLPVLIGRRPSPPRLVTGEQPRLIAVPSPDNEVSSTHARIEQVGDTVVVTDLRSTNGTTVVPADGRSIRLRSGESAVVLLGAVVDIGDGNIIEITAARGDR